MSDTQTNGKVLLLHIPGADWRLIGPALDAGHLPHLDALISRGTIANLASHVPLRSPVTAVGIATGRDASGHGVFGPLKVDATTQRIQPIQSSDIEAPFLWEHLVRAGKKAFAVGWPGTHPVASGGASVISDVFALSQGQSFEDWPLDPHSYTPDLPEDLMRDLRFHHREVTPQMLLPFVEEPTSIDLETDDRLGLLAGMLARTTTLHGVATWIAEMQEWDCLAVNFDFIERLTSAFLQYMPPQLPHVTDTDFKIYQNVVSGAYRFFDLLLQRYVELVGSDCTIMIASGHGYHIGNLRRPPTPGQAWVPGTYRSLGILAAAGPSIKEDAIIFGPMQTDIVPTCLAMLRVALPACLTGKVMEDVFKTPLNVEMSSAADEPRVGTPGAPDIPLWSHLISEMANFGYVSAIAEDAEEAAETAEIAWQTARADFCISKADNKGALEALDMVLNLAPDLTAARFKKAQCHLNLGETDACREMLEDLDASGDDSAFSDFFKGLLAVKERDVKAAKEHFSAAEAKVAKPETATSLLDRLGRSWLGLDEPERAEQLFRKVLSVDGDDALANGGLGKALVLQKRDQDAVGALKKSLSALRQQPEIHAFLGHALFRLKDFKEAGQSYKNALAIAPSYKAAKDGLERVGRALGNAAADQSGGSAL